MFKLMDKKIITLLRYVNPKYTDGLYHLVWDDSLYISRGNTGLKCPNYDAFLYMTMV